jgi:hypothetical protein
MIQRRSSVLSGIHAWTLVLSLSSLLIYLLTVLWPFLGGFGRRWSDFLNRGVFGDLTVWMLSLSALFVLVVIIFGEITHRRSKSLLVIGGTWCLVWLCEFVMIHKFVVFR